MFENQKKKRKYGNKKYVFINHHLKDCLDIESNCLLRRADDRGSANVICRISRISLVCGSGMTIEVRKYVTHRISNTNE